MTFFRLLSEQAYGERARMLALASLGGVASALFFATINEIAAKPEAGDVPSLVRLGLLILLYVTCTRHSTSWMAAQIEAILHQIKLRVARRIARTDLETLEQVRAAEICDRITENTSFISARAGTIAAMLGAVFLVGFALIYIAALSAPAFVLVFLLCGAGALIFLTLPRKFVPQFQKIAGLRLTFFEQLTDLLSGFKELKLSRLRSRQLRADIAHILDLLRDAGAATSNLLTDGMLLGEAILFSLIAAVVYALPLYTTPDKVTMTSLVAGVMFLWGPFMKVIIGTMPLVRADAAFAEIDELERKLEAAAQSSIPDEERVDPWHGRLAKLEASNLTYSYPADGSGQQFHIGPINLTLAAGEVIFIVGGNGSGKSTLLKVLLGLYAPSSGRLLADGVAVEPKNVAAFRDMISAIFSDFHLFAKLYGLAGSKEADVLALIARMRLADKTAISAGAFTSLSLSTGQRKRLAMVVALLEDRPIYVFDEWAADQDPEFRAYFYQELLPLLRQEGKTVLVVSHDDRYFHCADRVIAMEYGKVRASEKTAAVQVPC
ncbi:MAG TPA: cyclic peptide export ABC transporter [Pseudomonadota bacterium]|nr:cyclic peptide export ABC transporter [Pseudomonadota bacterium]